jgi:chemotaxis-related protein WspD
MNPEADSARELYTLACWEQSGVHGDRTCEKLPQAVHCRNCDVFSSRSQELLRREAPAKYLDELTRQLAENDQPAAEVLQSFLVFRIGDEWLALDAQCVVEVVEPRAVRRIPHRSDRRLLGLTNVRGELHLCISLSELLGIERVESKSDATTDRKVQPNPRFVVVQFQQERWAFAVDHVDGIHRVPKGSLEKLPPTVEKSGNYYSESLFSLREQDVAVLSETRLVPALERTVR